MCTPAFMAVTTLYVQPAFLSAAVGSAETPPPAANKVVTATSATATATAAA